MIRTVLVSLPLVLFSLVGSHSLQAAESAAELYGKGREIESVSISPDGTPHRLFVDTGWSHRTRCTAAKR